MLYRIQTEDLNRYSIERIVSNFFDGFTIISVSGFYKGMRENAIIIEIMAVESEMVQNQIKAIATAIRILNKQECVLISAIESKWELI